MEDLDGPVSTRIHTLNGGVLKMVVRIERTLTTEEWDKLMDYMRRSFSYSWENKKEYCIICILREGVNISLPQMMSLSSILHEKKNVSKKYSLGTVIVAGEFVKLLHKILIQFYTPVKPFMIVGSEELAENVMSELLKNGGRAPRIHSP